MQIYLVISLIIALLAVLFAVQNNQPVTVSFLIWEYQSTSAMVIILAILAGVLISLFASLPAMGKNKWALRNQRKRTAELETQLNENKLKLAETEQKAADLEKALAEAKKPPTG